MNQQRDEWPVYNVYKVQYHIVAVSTSKILMTVRMVLMVQ